MARTKQEESAPARKSTVRTGFDKGAPAAARAKASSPDAAQAPAVRKPRATKESAASEFDDLSNLAIATKAYEDEIRSQVAGSNTWIKIIQPGANQLVKGTKEYIKQAQAGDFLIPVGDGKFVAKETLRVTPLGLFKLYTEKKPSTGPSEMAQTVSFWLPEDAEQIPLLDGDNFKRILKNGNYLQPMHWMFVYIHEFPDIQDALIPFQSIGNGYFTKIQKIVKSSSSLCTELVLDLKTEGVLNDEFNKTYFYPIATVVGKNFDFVAETGKVELVKGGMTANQVGNLLKLSNAMQKEYSEHKLVTKRSQQQLIASVGALAPIERKGLPGSTRGGYAQDTEDENLKF